MRCRFNSCHAQSHSNSALRTNWREARRKDPSLKVKYGINVVPTQIFCDPSGKEIGRHEGYASEQEIIKQLKALGYDLMDMSKTDLLPE